MLTIIFTVVIFISYETLTEKKVTEVSVAVSRTPLSAPFYIAQEQDFFAQTCVSVNIVDVYGGNKAFEEVIDGNVDFATSSDTVLAFQSLNDLKFVTHATFVQSDNDVKLITRANDNIGSGKDLVNKRIGVIRSSASEYYLSIYLALAGLSFDDIQLIYYSPNQLLGAFQNNEVDAIVPWEPFAFKSIQQLGDQAQLHKTKNIYTLTFNLISKELYTNEQIDQAKCLLDGLSLAIDYIASKPKHAQQIIQKKLQLSPEFISWTWPDYIFKLNLNRSLLLNIESQANWAIKYKMTKQTQSTDANNFIDSRALMQINPMAVNIRP